MAIIGGAGSLSELREAVLRLPPPVIVFNKSHSGSRLVARLLAEAGVFLGAERNASEDAVPLLPALERLVLEHYPDYGPLWRDGADTAEIAQLLASGLERHLAGYAGGPWGWKLCETVYMLPVLDYLFPAARYVHLIRDGRDVAFANHVAPRAPFWQKIYVDAVGVGRWRGLFLGRHAHTFYRFDAPRYNAQHWVNSVSLGRRYGQMLRERYCELRYEALCRDFVAEGGRLLQFAGVPDAGALRRLAAEVRADAIGKHRRMPRWRVRQVERYARPLLVELGYLD